MTSFRPNHCEIVALSLLPGVRCRASSTAATNFLKNERIRWELTYIYIYHLESSGCLLNGRCSLHGPGKGTKKGSENR